MLSDPNAESILGFKSNGSHVSNSSDSNSVELPGVKADMPSPLLGDKKDFEIYENIVIWYHNKYHDSLVRIFWTKFTERRKSVLSII